MVVRNRDMRQKELNIITDEKRLFEMHSTSVFMNDLTQESNEKI